MDDQPTTRNFSVVAFFFVLPPFPSGAATGKRPFGKSKNRNQIHQNNSIKIRRRLYNKKVCAKTETPILNVCILFLLGAIQQGEISRAANKGINKEDDRRRGRG